MRLTLLAALILLPLAAQAADGPRRHRVTQTIVITKVVAATPVPSYGPYSCSAAQVRSGCFNYLNTSSHFGLFEGAASCVCSRMGR